MNMVKITIAIGLTLLLQSCATYHLINSSEESRFKSNLLFRDEIISIAKPAKPIAGYEDAVVFMGREHTFLVQEQSSTAFAPVNFQKIFTHADLNHLYINNNSSLGLDNFVESIHQDKIPTPKEIRLDNMLSTQQHTHSFYLTFVKPINQVQKGEKETMQGLGMACYDKYEKYPQYLVCYRLLHSKFTLAQNPMNGNQTKYGLKQPLKISVFNVQEVEGRKSSRLLLPLAVAFDIATFPVQFIMLQNADWR